MKKKFVYLLIIVTLFNLVAIGTLIQQHLIAPEQDRRTATRDSRFEQIKTELALTPDQVRHFEEIRGEFHSRVDSLSGELEELSDQLIQEIWSTQPGAASVDSLLNQISQLQMQSQRTVIWHFYQFKNVLSDEQWQKFYGVVSQRFPAHGRGAGSECPVQLEKDNK